MRVVEIKCESAKDLTDRLYSAAPSAVYRGHWDAGWKLLPRAWRRDGLVLLNDLFPREFAKGWMMAQGIVTTAAQQDQAGRVLLELHAAIEFFRNADRVGLEVPDIEFGRLGRWPDAVSVMGQEIDRQRVGLLETASDWMRARLYELPQHHGIPTRLLDWSRDPLVACFFACEPPPRPGEEEPKDLAVWSLYADELRIDTDLAPQFEIVEPRRFRHGYLHAQAGLFTLDRLAERMAVNGTRSDGEFQPLDESVSQVKRGPFVPVDLLTRYTLPHSKRGELVQLLRRRGVDSAFVRPTYDSIVPALRAQTK